MTPTTSNHWKQAAMERYFTQVPDKWTTTATGPPGV